MSSTGTAAAAALTATLGLAGVCWVIVVRQMNGMDMGVATELGSFASFIAIWVPMMAAMMLPGAAPAVLRRAQANGHLGAVLLFVGSYLAVWTLAGVAVYALYRSHGSTAAGALVIAAGIYELTPLKRECRQRCLESVRSGFEYGLFCIGSSIGLMLMLVALGLMSITWMSVITVLVVDQKLLRPRAAIDVPLAAAIIGLGILIIVAPLSAPQLMPEHALSIPPVVRPVHRLLTTRPMFAQVDDHNCTFVHARASPRGNKSGAGIGVPNFPIQIDRPSAGVQHLVWWRASPRACSRTGRMKLLLPWPARRSATWSPRPEVAPVMR